MRTRRTAQLLLTVLVLGVTALASRRVASAAEAVRWPRQPAPPLPTVTFGTTTRWEPISGTRVYRVTETSRPSYDLFRFGSKYYAFNDGYWYRSSSPSRGYIVIEDRYVPVALAGVPHDQWRSYPPGWMNPKNPHFNGRHDNGKGSDKGWEKGSDKGSVKGSDKGHGGNKH